MAKDDKFDPLQMPPLDVDPKLAALARVENEATKIGIWAIDDVKEIAAGTLLTRLILCAKENEATDAEIAASLDSARERFKLEEEERVVAAARRARASGFEFVVPDLNEKQQRAGLTLQDLTTIIHKDTQKQQK